MKKRTRCDKDIQDEKEEARGFVKIFFWNFFPKNLQISKKGFTFAPGFVTALETCAFLIFFSNPFKKNIQKAQQPKRELT